MDLFEYILVITSVVYALAMAQILLGVGRLIQTDVKIRWFLPHTLWTLILFVGLLLTWWAGWEFRAVEWTFAKFVYVLITPVLIFLAASLIIPRAVDGQEVDLEKHFLQIRRPFLWSFTLVFVAQYLDGPIIGSEQWWWSGRIFQIAMLSVTIAGTFTTNRRLLTVFSVAVLLWFAYVVLTRFMLPGWEA